VFTRLGPVHHARTLAALAALALVSGAARDASAAGPVPSFSYLPTGNGHGFQVFDASQNAITYFLERPYRYLRPNPNNPSGDGIVRRDLAYDTYFGVRVSGQGTWLAKKAPSELGYVEQSNVIRSVVTVGAIKTESFFFAPFGYEGNAMVMVLTATNTSSTPQTVDAFSVHNFKLGPAPNPDEPGDSGESVQWDGVSSVARETGPGGGTVMYVPIGGADVSTCANGAWQTVASGGSLTPTPTCSGNDLSNLFQKNLGAIPAGESRSFGVVVLFDGDGNPGAALARWQAFAAGRDAKTLFTDALAEWAAWRQPVPGLSADEQRIWRQSEAVLRMGQVREPNTTSPKRKGNGMVLASLPPGGWHTGWVRDAVYAIVALARVGHHAEARAALDFFLAADAGKYKSYLGNVDYRVSVVRYFGNGEEEADYSGQPTPNIELDGWGLVLWAARTYLDASGDDAWLGATTGKGDTVYDALRNGIAEPLMANLEPQGMVIAEASIWEVHWGNREHFMYTTASAARGLCDMAAIARRAGNLSDRDRYQQAAERVRTALVSYFVDQKGAFAGTIEKLAKGSNYHDGATIEAFTWDLVPITDKIATATLAAMSNLVTPVGGYKRLEGSSDQYDSDEWILIDLRAADAFRRAGRGQRADALVDFVTAQARANYDLIPELYNTSASSGQIGRYTGSIPMVGYGAGAYLLTQLAAVGRFERTDCGSEAPVDPADGGPMYVDAGPEADAGEAGGSADVYTGTACVCRAGGAGAPRRRLGGDGLALVGLGLGVAARRARRLRRE
jgi:GH15 family glucan-1,4-alpha-glucosidase